MIKHQKNRGHVGLFLLLITLAVVVFLIMLQWGGFAKKDELGRSKIEQDLGSIKDAENVKNMIEQRNVQYGIE